MDKKRSQSKTLVKWQFKKLDFLSLTVFDTS